jgi:F-type H+-transporting ATPase subunit a
MGCGCSLPIFVGIIVLLIFGFLAGPIGEKLVGIQLPAWMTVARPEVSLPAEPVFFIGGAAITNSIITSWLTIIVLGVLAYIATRKAKLIPGRFQSAVEWVTDYIYIFCKEVAGEKNGRRFFPLIMTIFIYVATNAILAQLPFWGTLTIVNAHGDAVPLLRGANTDANLPAALALVSFIFVGYYGIKEHKLGFIKQYLNFGALRHGFKGIIDVFVGILELLSVFIRIVSFTFRLFGNMTAGEILILMVMFLVPWVATVPFYGLELLVGYIQALIFAGLTLVFLTLAVAHHEH